MPRCLCVPSTYLTRAATLEGADVVRWRPLVSEPGGSQTDGEAAPRKAIVMATVTVGGAPPSPVLYPVHVDAASVPDQPSRALWLVKWALIVPHVLVLAALWVTFSVLSVMAFFAILATGRYPRAIFDFNVGVLRWTWRVRYYAYGVLGTDRYPPFSLAEDREYPAHLEIDYPQRLSRGLVLVKWWLLALPQYVIVALFVGGGIRVGSEVAGWSGETEWQWEPGLIGLLVIVAAFALLFTGAYPRGIYDLLVGLNRWVLRVVAYAGLMTDAYPPFRLDQGGEETPPTLLPAPGGAQPLTSGPSAGVTSLPPPRDEGPAGPSAWTVGPILAVVIGSLVLLGGLALFVGGGVLLAGDRGLRRDGYVTSPILRAGTDGYAIVTDEVVLQGERIDRFLGQVRVRAVAADGSDLFVGLASAEDAAAYLNGVEHTVLIGADGNRAREIAGSAPPVAPAGSTIWLVSAAGTGWQELVVPAQPGEWVVVMMRASPSRELQVSYDVGATLPWLPAASVVAVVLGLVASAAGGTAIVLGVRAASVRG